MKDRLNTGCITTVFTDFAPNGPSFRSQVLSALDQQLKSEPVATLPRSFHDADYYHFLPLLRKNAVVTRDSFHFILNAVVNTHAMPAFNSGYGHQDPRPLSTELLKVVLGNDYKAYVDTLVNGGVIRLVSLQGEGRSRKYILGAAYQNQPLKVRPYKDARIRSKIKKARREHFMGLKKLYLAYAPIIGYTWSPGLQLDEERAATFYLTFLNQLLHHAKTRI
jgi:hypothetical protein